jgi:tetratricopeptide (TPR) repeat protein
LTVFLLAPSAKVQQIYSGLETAVSRQEIGMLRSTMREWLDKKGYINDKYILVVRPKKERPSFADQYSGDKALEGNAVLASAENPIEIPWMFNAVMRELLGHSTAGKIEILDCYFDQICAKSAVVSGQAALELTDGDEVIRNYEFPYIINFSLLTSQPVYPAIKKFRKVPGLEPWNAEHFISQGRQDLRSGDLASGIIDFTKAADISPEDAETYIYRGIAYGREGRLPQAIADLSKAIDIYPKYAAAYYNRAGTYYLLKDYDNAWKDAHKAKELGYPADPGFIHDLKKQIYRLNAVE